VKWINLRVRGTVTGILNLGSSVTVVNVLGLALTTVLQVGLLSCQVIVLTDVIRTFVILTSEAAVWLEGGTF